MVPRLGKSGTSFKGALAYYMHDKSGAGQGKATTSDRVAWTATRNMITDDIDTATRVMIATAMQAQDLKAAAGIEATGRKSQKSVFHYSLAWHDEENGKIDRAEMMRAAESSLIALGAEHLQAVIVCHQDEQHPHVHIVLNRVQEDGRLFNPSYTKETLSRWAYAYREARGEQEKYCPDRHAKMQRSRKGQEVQPDPVQRKEHVQTQLAEQTAKMQREPSRAAQIAAKRDELKAKHKREWEALGHVYKARKDAAWKYRPNYKAIVAQHKADTRADWSNFGKQQAAQRRNYYRDEKTLRGILHNAVAAVNARGLALGQSGFLTSVFRFVLIDNDRKAAFLKHQEADKKRFAAGMGAQLEVKIAAAKVEHAAKLERARDEYLAKKSDLQARQKLEQGEIREAWKAYYAERDQAKAQDPRLVAPVPKRQQEEQARRAALDAARAARSEPAPTRADRAAIAKGEQPWRERLHANRFSPPKNTADQRQEPPIMQNEFDKARRLAPSNIPARPSSAPIHAPQPSPMGAAPAPVQRQSVPKIDRAADFAATPKGQEVVARQAPKASPDALRTKAAEPFKAPTAAPAMPAPASSATKDIWSKSAAPKEPEKARDIWNDKAKPNAERRHRDRSKDLDFDRDR